MKHFAWIFFISTFSLFSQIKLTGTIEGVVVDAATRSPLIGANVIVVHSTLGAITDLDGKFIIHNIPVGNYTLQFRFVGYSTITKTDIIIRPQRITTVSGELSELAVQTEQVTVTAGYFQQTDVQQMSAVGFSREEIRRAPGSGGDVSRIILGLPSLAKVNDQSNSLMVRGGSPLENAFYLDGIEIPNINHFPTQGATGGPIGMVNVDLIDEVNFYSGGFSSAYGDKLSSVLELKYREGNRNEWNGQLDLNIMGFGGVGEGPIDHGKGSWMLSVRRSYLDLIMKMINIGTSVAPNYGDVQGKISYDIAPNHKLNIIAINGDDHNNPDNKAAEENDMVYYGNQDIYQNAAGISWRALWNKDMYSITSLGYLSSLYAEDFYETNTAVQLVHNRSNEQAMSLRNINHVRFSEHHSIEFGIEAKRAVNSYDNFYGQYTNAVGDSTPAVAMNKNIFATKLGGFFTYIVQPLNGFTTAIGARADYFSLHERVTIAPRVSFSYRADALTTIKFSSGMYYQNLPLLLLSQNDNNKNLRDPYAVHYIAGVDRLLTEDTKLSIELYQKEYYGFPLDPTEPSLFLVDEVFYRYGFFFNHNALTSDGRARANGIELMLQKKLAENFYGLASASLFRTEYKGADGVWRKRVFDNQIIVSVEGGYKPNSEWEFSARWIYAGGSPYTPFNLPQSQQLKRAVLDGAKVNEARYPAYHSLNVRFDKRFHFERSNLVIYLSVWNAYDRKNIATYFWNEKKNKQDTIYQWNLLPMFGVEYEL